MKTFFEARLKSINIGHLLLLLLGLHIFAMSFPNQTGQEVFDESYYTVASEDLLKGIPNNLEHPFFGKIWGAIGIEIFGNNFFGWRIFYVMIGVLAVWVFYELARVFFSKEKALFAASMLGFETLFFIHTSLLLLEGPPILFALIGFLAYFKKRYYWSAIAFGLSILSKEWGIYFLFALFLYHVWATKSIPLKNLLTGPRLKNLIVFVVLVIVVVGLPLQAYDNVYHPYANTTTVIIPEVITAPNGTTITTTTNTTSSSNPITNAFQNFEYYYSYHTNLPLSNSDLADPWDHLPWYWILPLDINPSPYYVTTITITTTGANGAVLSRTYLHPIDWLGIGNLVIWYSIWIIVPILIIKAIRRLATQLDALIAALIAGTYGPNVLLSLIYHRVEYSFYFINTDPALALGIPMVITFIAPDSQRYQRFLMAIWLAAAIIFFILFFPIHPLDGLSG